MEPSGYLPLTVAAPRINISSGGKGEYMFTTHGNVLYKQPLQGRHHLRGGFILQHGIWQTNQTV